MTELLDMTFSVSKNQDQEEDEKRKAEEKRQANIIAVTIGNALNIPKSSKGKHKDNRKKVSCFNCKKTGHWAHNYSKPPPGSSSTCQRIDVPDSWQLRTDCSHSLSPTLIKRTKGLGQPIMPHPQTSRNLGSPWMSWMNKANYCFNFLL